MRPGGRGARWLAAGVVAALLGSGLAPASASEKRDSGRRPAKLPMEFSGSCQFSGPVTFSPGLTTNPQLVRQAVRAPGACSGTVVDGHGRTHKLQSSPVTYRESARANGASCLDGTPTGSGTLRFRWGKLHFAFSEKRATATAVVSLSGRMAGSAAGLVTPSRSENPAARVPECANQGIKLVHIDVNLTTTPSISG